MHLQVATISCTVVLWNYYKMLWLLYKFKDTAKLCSKKCRIVHPQSLNCQEWIWLLVTWAQTRASTVSTHESCALWCCICNFEVHISEAWLLHSKAPTSKYSHIRYSSPPTPGRKKKWKKKKKLMLLWLIGMKNNSPSDDNGQWLCAGKLDRRWSWRNGCYSANRPQHE